jgi:hypothetical protein
VITLEQAKQLTPGTMLHSENNKNADGTCQRWKVNGRVILWKRSPDRVHVPVKHGLRHYDIVTENDLTEVHLASECEHAN